MPAEKLRAYDATDAVYLSNRLSREVLYELKQNKSAIEVPIGIYDYESGYEGPTSLVLTGTLAKRWRVLQGKIFRMSVPFSETAQDDWYDLVKKRHQFEAKLLSALNAKPLVSKAQKAVIGITGQ